MSTVDDIGVICYPYGMKRKKERPQVRVYPEDYQKLVEQAEKRVTPIAQIIHEALEKV